MLNKKFLYFILLVGFTGMLFFNVNAVSVDAGIVPGSVEQKKTGDYGLNDFVLIAVNVSKFILGIVGSLCLLMFIYGGILIILSGESTITEGGKSNKINRGKDAIKNAIVGLVIVFISYAIITFVFKALGINTGATGWGTSGWFEPK